LLSEVITTRKMIRTPDCINGLQLDTLVIPVMDEINNPVKVVVFCQDESDRINASRKLLEAYQMLTSLIEHMPLALVTLDKDYRVKLWSAVAEERSGLKASEVYGLHVSEILKVVPPEFLQLLEDSKTQNITERILFNFELQSGKMMPTKVNIASIINAEGEADGTVLIMELVTE
jgi:PAS domain S-box-containing protein